VLALKKGAALLERMVHAGSVCLRRLAGGKRRHEVQFNRFLGNRKVTLGRLVAGWSQTTRDAVAGRHILAIQDTSEINFRTTRQRTRGLGEIGKGVGRGVLLHAMVAIDAESQACLGLVAGDIWSRTGRISTPHGKRPLDQKESRRWVETAAAARDVLRTATRVTLVADREADMYVLWAQSRRRASMCWAGFTMTACWSAAAGWRRLRSTGGLPIGAPLRCASARTGPNARPASNCALARSSLPGRAMATATCPSRSN
jgi:hypothetical protein